MRPARYFFVIQLSNSRTVTALARISRGSGFILQKGSSENPRLRVSLVLLRRVCYILRNNRSGQQNNGGKNRRCRIYGTYHHADSSGNGVAYGSPRSLLPLSPLPAAGRNSPFHPCRLRRRGLPERKNGRQKKNSCFMGPSSLFLWSPSRHQRDL